MHLFVDISSHGFGHLAIAAPVLNALAEMAPDFRFTIRSGLPRQKLAQRIRPPFTLIAGSSDFGYVMIDATRINLAASAAAYRHAHADWPATVAREAAWLAVLKPDLVITNVAYLPLAGTARLGIPALSLCSLNWADLFAHFFGHEPWAAPIHGAMLAAYRSARTFLRVTPGMPMHELSNLDAVGPIATIGQHHDLGLNGNKAVLIAMGGIDHRLPVENWPRLPGIRWLVAADWECAHPDAIALESFGLSFTDLLCSVRRRHHQARLRHLHRSRLQRHSGTLPAARRLAGAGLPDRLATAQRPLPGDCGRLPARRWAGGEPARALAAAAAATTGGNRRRRGGGTDIGYTACARSSRRIDPATVWFTAGDQKRQPKRLSSSPVSQIGRPMMPV